MKKEACEKIRNEIEKENAEYGVKAFGDFLLTVMTDELAKGVIKEDKTAAGFYASVYAHAKKNQNKSTFLCDSENALKLAYTYFCGAEAAAKPERKEDGGLDLDLDTLFE